jgi:tetratricopeptide (TPR) repeat protein
VRGELDWIVMKALEKDRNRRYESASGLARDLERYLANEAVEACPPGTGYRLRKFLRRNRRPVLAAVVVLAALVAGVTVSTWQAVRATAAQRNAEREAARARALNDYLVNHFLTEAEPGRNPRDKPITLEEILDKSGQQVDQVFAQQPELAASLHFTFGSTYYRLGLWDRADTHLQKAVTTRRELFGPDRFETLEAVDKLAAVRQGQGRPAEAEQLLRANLETSRRCLGPEHWFTLMSMNNLAASLFDGRKLEEAEALNRECLDLYRRLIGPENLNTLITEHNLATTLMHRGKVDEAEPLLRANLETLRRAHGPAHPTTLVAEQNLVQLLKERGNLAEAGPLGRQNLEANRRVFGVDHRTTQISRNNLEWVAIDLISAGQSADAAPLLRDCLAVREQAEPDDWATFNARALLGGCLLDQRKYAEAEPLLLKGQEGMKQRRDRMPADAKDHLPRALARLVELYEATGKADEAARWRKELFAGAELLPPPRQEDP